MDQNYINIINKAKYGILPKKTFQTKQYNLESGKIYKFEVKFKCFNANRERFCSNIYCFEYAHEVSVCYYSLIYKFIIIKAKLK